MSELLRRRGDSLRDGKAWEEDSRVSGLHSLGCGNHNQEARTGEL